MKAVFFIFIVGVLFLVSACQNGQSFNATDVPEVDEVFPSPTATMMPAPSATPQATATVFILPTPAGTATPLAYEGLSCYTENIPYAYAESPAVLGWKIFAQQERLPSRVVYFPTSCTHEDIERDVEQLFFHRSTNDEITLLLLHETNQGTLGKLYAHLVLFEFWAMGPEDYPKVLHTNRYMNPHVLIFRIDRLYGEGHEGPEILSQMIGLAEHEFVHTVQARNNVDLADMIWSDGTYRAFIERYANLNNNSAFRYRNASQSFLRLLQMLDGLYINGTLDMRVAGVLEEMGFTLEEYLAQEVLMYDSHVRALIVNVQSEKYLQHLTREPLNPLLLITRAGAGDILSYDLVRLVYDRYVGEYNLWYYGRDSSLYLPASFDALFTLSEGH